MARNVRPEALEKNPWVVHKATEGARRPNLVFFRCGRNSLHYRLFPLPAHRSWDCMLSFYEAHRPEDIAHADFVLSGGVSKWDAFARARFGSPGLGLEQYRHFFLVDDDIGFQSAEDIDRLFDIARDENFAVCQPSLSPESHTFWDVARHHPSWHVRYTNFVECMAPVFSAAAVTHLEHELKDAVSGCGLDLVLHAALRGIDGRLGVVDAVTVSHEKPVDLVNGAFYKMLRSIGVDHDEEIRYFLNRYSLEGISAQNLGGVTRVQHFYPQYPTSS